MGSVHAGIKKFVNPKILRYGSLWYNVFIQGLSLLILIKLHPYSPISPQTW